jgi:hypothetical protein
VCGSGCGFVVVCMVCVCRCVWVRVWACVCGSVRVWFVGVCGCVGVSICGCMDVCVGRCAVGVCVGVCVGGRVWFGYGCVLGDGVGCVRACV